MADKKISALTAATTPLAGTEVLPIVQSGSTVKVSAANLTAGRTVSAANYTIESGGKISSASDLVASVASSANSIYFGGGGTPPAQVWLQSIDTAIVYVNGATRLTTDNVGNHTVNTGNLVIGTAGKGITNSTGSVALNFSTVGTALTGGAQSVLTGSFNNVGTAQTITPADTNGGYIVITGIQPGIGSTTYTLPFVKRGGTAAIGTPSKAILTADPLLSVVASGGDIVVTPIAGNTYITYAIYYTPLGA